MKVGKVAHCLVQTKSLRKEPSDVKVISFSTNMYKYTSVYELPALLGVAQI